NTPYLIIANNTGAIYSSIQMPAACTDFKKQPNGNLSYFSELATESKFYELNTSYNKIDSFSCGNGYATDQHELKILANGHALLIGVDPEVVNMSLLIPGGHVNAIVVG